MEPVTVICDSSLTLRSTVLTQCLRRDDFDVAVVPLSELGSVPPGIVALAIERNEPMMLGVIRHLSANRKLAGLIVIADVSSSAMHARLMDAGADFCLARDAIQTLLPACIRSMMRRKERDSARASDPRLPPNLRRMEEKLYRYLSANSERWVSARELARNVVGVDTPFSEGAVRVHLCNLRKALGDMKHRIASKRGFGYRFTRALPDSCHGTGSDTGDP